MLFRDGQRWAQFRGIENWDSITSTEYSVTHKMRHASSVRGTVVIGIVMHSISKTVQCLIRDAASFDSWGLKRNLVRGEPDDLETTSLADAQLPGPRTCGRSRKSTRRLWRRETGFGCKELPIHFINLKTRAIPNNCALLATWRCGNEVHLPANSSYHKRGDSPNIKLNRKNKSVKWDRWRALFNYPKRSQRRFSVVAEDGISLCLSALFLLFQVENLIDQTSKQLNALFSSLIV
jgi:hypothetical protein